MIVRALLLVAALLGPAVAEAVVFVTPPGVTCTADTSRVATATAVIGQDFCFDSTTNQLNVWGGAWIPVTGAAQVNVRAFGAKCDGVTDDSTALQTALTAASGKTFTLYIPPGGICVYATGLTSTGVVGIAGSGKWQSELRYTGSGTGWKPTNGSTGFIEVQLSDLMVSLTNTGAVALDASQMLGSTVRSVRFFWAGAGAQGGTGLLANPTAGANSPFYNTCLDCYFDGLQTAIKLDTQQGTGPPNRWTFMGTKVLGASGANTTAGPVIGTASTNKVSGLAFYGLDCEQQGGNCVTLGANADSITFVDTTQETTNGGTLWSCDVASNRTQIYGYKVKAGTIGACAGTRAVIVGGWDDIRITNSTNGSADLVNINGSGANGGLYLGLGPGATPDKGVGTVNAGAGYWTNSTQGTSLTYTMCKTGACATSCTIIVTGGIVTGGTCSP